MRCKGHLDFIFAMFSIVRSVTLEKMLVCVRRLRFLLRKEWPSQYAEKRFDCLSSDKVHVNNSYIRNLICNSKGDL